MTMMRTMMIAMATVVIGTSAAPAAALEKIGVVGAVSDVVTATDTDKTARTLSVGDAIYLGDVVNSDAGGEAQLIFLDRSTLTINASTQITVDKFVYNPATSNGDMAIEGAKGAFRFIGGALSKKKPVTIKTPVATIGIRGGIADTHITPGSGATDAIFVYGEEMTMENQAGDVTSTTELGTGFNMATANSAPAALPPAVVQQRMASFKSEGDAVGGKSVPESEDVQQKMELNTDEKEPEPAPEPTANEESGDTPAASGAPEGDADNAEGDHADGGDTQESHDGPDMAGGDEGDDGGDNGPVDDMAGMEPGDDSPDAEGTDGPAFEDGPFVGDHEGPDAGPDAGPMEFGGEPTTDGPVFEGFDSGLEVDTTEVGQTAGEANNETQRIDIIVDNVPEDFEGEEFADDLNFILEHDDDFINEHDGGEPLPPLAEDDGVIFEEEPPLGDEPVDEEVVADDSPPPPSPPSPPPATAYQGRYWDTQTAAPMLVESGGVAATVDGAGDFVVTVSPVFPSPLADRTATITVDTGAGYHGFTSVGIDRTDDATANPTSHDMHSFSSPNGAMQYLRFQDQATPYDQTAVILGTHVGDVGAAGANSAGHASASNGVSFYDFLPDPSVYLNASTPEWGLFHHNIADGALLADFSVPVAGAVDDFGMAVDWGTGRFLAGDVEFVGDGTYGPGVQLGMGKVYPGATGTLADPHLKGGIVYFEAAPVGTAISPGTTESEHGQMRVSNDIYGPGNALIEGMLFDTRVVNNNGVIPDPSDVFNASNDGDPDLIMGSQGVVLNNAPSAALGDLVADKTVAGYQGFAGGIIVEDIGTTPNPVVYSSDNVDDVSLTRAAVGSVGGWIKVNNGTQTVKGVFGTDAAPTTSNAFISDDLYAAQQGEMKYDTNNDTVFDVIKSGADVAQGVIVSGGMAPVADECLNCQYVDWGMWAGKVQNATGGEDVIHMLPYVAGDVTDSANIGNPGDPTVNYNGAAYGNFTDGAKIVNTTGTMDATVDLANRQVQSLGLHFGSVLSVADLNIESSADLTMPGTYIDISATGDAVFSDAAVQVKDGVSAIGTGDINGALFGPNAEDIGGNFNVTTGSVSGGGVFLGSQ